MGTAFLLLGCGGRAADRESGEPVALGMQVIAEGEDAPAYVAARGGEAVTLTGGDRIVALAVAKGSAYVAHRGAI